MFPSRLAASQRMQAPTSWVKCVGSVWREGLHRVPRNESYKCMDQVLGGCHSVEFTGQGVVVITDSSEGDHLCIL